MSPVGFETTIATDKRSQTYALDRAVTGTVYRLRFDVHISIEDATEIGRAGKEKRHSQQNLRASPLQVGSNSAAVNVLTERTAIAGVIWCDEKG